MRYPYCIQIPIFKTHLQISFRIRQYLKVAYSRLAIPNLLHEEISNENHMTILYIDFNSFLIKIANVHEHVSTIFHNYVFNFNYT